MYLAVFYWHTIDFANAFAVVGTWRMALRLIKGDGVGGVDFVVIGATFRFFEIYLFIRQRGIFGIIEVPPFKSLARSTAFSASIKP